MLRRKLISISFLTCSMTLFEETDLIPGEKNINFFTYYWFIFLSFVFVFLQKQIVTLLLHSESGKMTLVKYPVICMLSKVRQSSIVNVHRLHFAWRSGDNYTIKLFTSWLLKTNLISLLLQYYTDITFPFKQPFIFTFGKFSVTS